MLGLRFILVLLLGISVAEASESLSYSGRLVNADGSPVTNSVNLKFELAYTIPGGVAPALCSQQLTNVQLSNGVFHVKLDPDCTPLTLTAFLAQVPAGESVAIRVTDESANKTYSYQALYSIPFAQVAKQLVKMGANTNDILQWNGDQWIPASLGSIAGVGTVTQIDTGTGLTGGPITDTGTISIANSGVNTAQLADGAVTDLKVATGITRTKLANGTPNYVLMNNSSGVISEVAQIPVAQGGTGAANAADARTNLGLGTSAVFNYFACLPGEVSKFVLPGGWSCVADNDSLDTTKLPLAGGTMSGAINMGSNAIVNLPAPTNPTDAATMAYVDSQVGAINSSQWTTAGSDIYYDGGNVGIGTTTPTSPLQVNLSANAGFRFLTGTNGDPTLKSFGSSSAVYTRYSSMGPLTFYAGGTDAVGITPHLFIGNTGNVGVGISNPTNKMEVNGNLAVSGIVRLKSDNTNYVELRAPTALASTLSFIFPGSLGTAGQALITDGAGNLSWSSVATSASTVGGDLNGTISNAQINTGAVGSSEIADLSVADSDIANNTISYGKLNLADASIPQAKVNGLTTALSGKEPTITAGDSTQFWRGDKTWQILNTTAVPEGTNLYFLDSRVRSALMTGYAAGSALALAPTDSLLQALGKLEGQIIANKAAFDGTGQWSKNGTSVHYNGGNVGVGTSTPTALLNAFINSSTYVEPLFRVQQGGSFTAMTDYVANFQTYGNRSLLGNGTQHGLYVQAGWDADINNTEIARFSALNGGYADVPRMVIKSNGNVGIGTTSPVSKLHVEGSANFGGSFSNNNVGTVMVKGNGPSQGVTVWNETGVTTLRMWADAANDTGHLTRGDSATNGISITGAGKVGIGTTTPQGNLDVQSSSGSAVLALTSYHATQGSHFIGFRGRGTAAAPTEPLANDHLALFQGRSVLSPNSYPGMRILAAENFTPTTQGAQITFHTTLNGTATDAERMRITNDGLVGIGMTDPTERLHVNGNTRLGPINPVNTGTFPAYGASISFSGGPAGATFNSDNSDPIFMARYNAASDASELRVSIGDNPSGVDKFNVGYSLAGVWNSRFTAQLDGIGLFHNGTQTCTINPASGVACSSDMRLKENINPIENALDKVLAINGVTFMWKNDEAKDRKRDLGFIAQNVEKSVPELVIKDSKGFKQVNYANFVAVLTEGLKEFYSKWVDDSQEKGRQIASIQEQNAELGQRVQALEKENKELREAVCEINQNAKICKK